MQSLAPPPRLLRRSSLLLLCALAACGGGGSTQPPPEPLACLNLPEEVSVFEGTLAHEWRDIAIDARNRLWLVGYGNGRLGESTLDPSGNSRAVVRQLAPDGTLLWEAGSAFDTPGTDVAEAVTVAPDGSVVVAGRTTGMLTGTPNAGQFDTFVAWRDAQAAPDDWRFFQTGSERPQHPRRVAADASGRITVAGYDDDYIPTNFVEAWSDPFALRLQRTGAGTPQDMLSLQWLHRFDTEVPDFAEGLAVTDDGAHTYVSGVTLAGAQRGMYIRKLDAQGQVLWTARYSPVAADTIQVLRPQPDGTLWIAGNVLGSFQGQPSAGDQDFFVARISGEDGSVLASAQFGTRGVEWLTDMVVDAGGHLVVLGETTGAFAPGATPQGAFDLFLARLSPGGQLLSSRQWGTSADESARRVAVDSCGRVAAVAASTGPDGRRRGLLWYWRPG